MVLAKLPLRKQDDFGFGHYGAPRGSHTHEGVDLCAYPDTVIVSIAPGVISKIGYPYVGNYEYRYVEVRHVSGLRYRYFYVEPSVLVGDKVDLLTPLGKAQFIAKRYTNLKERKVMINHIHFEILAPDDTHIDPTGYVL